MNVVDDVVSGEGDPIDAAIAWHLRLPSATREEWQDFIVWLEASPENAAAYDRLTLDDALLAPSLDEVGPLPTAPLAANDVAESPVAPWHRARWAVLAVAAALAVAIALPRGGDGRFVIETAPGARKLVAFADGSRISLNGGSRLELEKGNTRFAALQLGEAMFEIRHDAVRPFIVKSGGLTLHDLGTTFNVVRNGKRLGLEVSEGAVMFEPAKQALTVRPGVALDVDESSRRVEFSRVANADVGSWRQGRLAFSGDRLAEAAAAVGRATGAKITVSSDLAETLFTGSLRLDPDHNKTVDRLARLSGAKARRNSDGWVLVSAGHASD